MQYTKSKPNSYINLGVRKHSVMSSNPANCSLGIIRLGSVPECLIRAAISTTKSTTLYKSHKKTH